MKFRIAIATKDGKVVTEHFGHCSRFSIVDIEKEGWKFIEFRVVEPPCVGGEHSLNALYKVVEEIKDCYYVVVSQIGFGAQQILKENLIGVKIHRGLVIDSIEEFWLLLRNPRIAEQV
jgi:predicted Fe-Mo cluster-binding NifX family protein